MGWLFSPRWGNRSELLAHLRSAERWGDNFELIRSSAVGNNHWYVARRKSDGLQFIGLDLMKGGTRREPGWGYKDLDESCGPVEVNCPLSYLELAGKPTGYAAEWRDRVREHHRRVASNHKTLTYGVRVRYGSHDYELTSDLGRKGWTVKRVADGAPFRMTARQLSEARLVTEEAVCHS